MKGPADSKKSFFPMVPVLILVMLTFVVGGSFVNQQNVVAVQQENEEATEDLAPSTPEPTESESGAESSSTNETETTNSSLNDDLEAALFEAQFYFDENYYCRAELISLLESDGFTSNAAVYAVDSLGADWLEEAAGKAYFWFESEGYTYEEVEVFLDSVGCTQQETDYALSGLG